jgi:hypothetical protein
MPSNSTPLKPHSIDLEQQMSQLHRHIIDNEQELRQNSLAHSTEAKNDAESPLPRVRDSKSQRTLASLTDNIQDQTTGSGSLFPDQQQSVTPPIVEDVVKIDPATAKKLLQRADLIHRALTACSVIQLRIQAKHSS